MSKTYMNLSIGFTALSPEHLPDKNGEPMYADDVAEEVSDVIQAALATWYQQRGNELLACEPNVG